MIGGAEAGAGWLRVAVRRRSQWVLDGCGPGWVSKKHRSPAEGEFLFEIGDTPLEEMLTSFGELPRFLRTARSLGLTVSVQRNLKLKQRRRGLDEASSLESFLALNAVGGECLEDFDVRRPSQGALSGPEDSIRPSSLLPQSLTDELWVDSTGPISESHVLA